MGVKPGDGRAISLEHGGFGTPAWILPLVPLKPTHQMPQDTSEAGHQDMDLFQRLLKQARPENGKRQAASDGVGFTETAGDLRDFCELHGGISQNLAESRTSVQRSHGSSTTVGLPWRPKKPAARGRLSTFSIIG